MSNSLTDAEIKKALECVLQSNNGLDKNNAIVALDLINRQDQENVSLKAEIERLQETIKILRVSVEQAHLVRKDGKSPLSLLTAEIKAEAYKECIEKVKAHYKECQFEYDYSNTCETLNNIYKELVGDVDE